MPKIWLVIKKVISEMKNLIFKKITSPSIKMFNLESIFLKVREGNLEKKYKRKKKELNNYGIKLSLKFRRKNKWSSKNRNKETFLKKELTK